MSSFNEWRQVSGAHCPTFEVVGLRTHARLSYSLVHVLNTQKPRTMLLSSCSDVFRVLAVPALSLLGLVSSATSPPEMTEEALWGFYKQDFLYPLP